MNSKTLAIAITVLGAITAGLAPLPYGWANIATTSLAAVVAALSPLNAGLARVYGKTTASNQPGNTKLPKKVPENT
jgi:hypothetical protein